MGAWPRGLAPPAPAHGTVPRLKSIQVSWEKVLDIKKKHS